MNPKIWGHSGWTLLYQIAFNYPINPDYQDVDNYSKFFHSLQPVLPCSICQINYAKHLQLIPIAPYLDSRDHLIEWLIKIQNLVNLDLKSQRPQLHQIEIASLYLKPQSLSTLGWTFLFSVAYEYPRYPTYTDILNYKRFFVALQNVLPPTWHRDQYQNALLSLPIDPYLTTTNYLFQWVLLIHNRINTNRQLTTTSQVLNIYFNNQLTMNGHQMSGQHQMGGQHQDPLINTKNMSMAVLIVVIGTMITKTFIDNN